MSTRIWIGMALALATASGAGAQQNERDRARAQMAMEHALLAAQQGVLHAEQAMLDAQLRTDLGASRVEHALLEAQLQSDLQLPLVQHQLEMQLAESGLHLAQMEPALLSEQMAIEHLLVPGISFGRSWQRELDALTPGEGPSLPQDPADSLYRVGRERLNRNDFQRAAEAFHRIRTEERYARSGYRAEAYYWEAFALARRGQSDELRQARELLASMQQQYPNEERLRDARALAAQIDGRLARTGDADATEQLIQQAVRSRAVSVSGARSGRNSNPQCAENEEEDIRIAALSALLNVDSDRTVPVLREVLQRRDECSAPLRRRALMLVARSDDPQATNILVDVARNDPDESVQEQAVLFLGSVKTPEARAALQTILQNSDNEDMQRRALMALAQQSGDEANALLRDYAARETVSPELRRHAVLLLAGRRGGGVDENAEFLRGLYGRTTDPEMRRSIIAVLARQQDAATVEWLMNIALDTNEDIDVRRQALFMAGRSEAVPVQRVVAMYDRAPDAELKEQVLLVLARREEDAALDKLIAVANNDSNIELRKKAIFWLGQSKNPRAPDALLEIIR